MYIILVQNPRVTTSNSGIKNSLLPGGKLEPDQTRVREDGGPPAGESRRRGNKGDRGEQLNTCKHNNHRFIGSRF